MKAALTFTLGLLACSGSVKDIHISLTVSGSLCDAGTLEMLGSLSVEVWGADAQGGSCRRARHCVSLSPPMTLMAIEDQLQAQGQPLLDVASPGALKIAVVGYRTPICTSIGDVGALLCGVADISTASAGRLPIPVRCKTTFGTECAGTVVPACP
ncbi:MAG TPA: hypothetical protein VKN99_25920 [Polyangia bacterium]|nr:hypothetical protein [Polyangia bacterium]